MTSLNPGAAEKEEALVQGNGRPAHQRCYLYFWDAMANKMAEEAGNRTIHTGGWAESPPCEKRDPDHGRDPDYHFRFNRFHANVRQAAGGNGVRVSLCAARVRPSGLR